MIIFDGSDASLAGHRFAGIRLNSRIFFHSDNFFCFAANMFSVIKLT